MNLFRRLKDLLGRGRGTDQARHTPQMDLGARGEEDAVTFLKQHGYRILERNFRCTAGEIDLIAFKDGVVAFVEVRARTEPAVIDPLYTVTSGKQQRLIRTAYRYSALRGLGREDVALRFDVVTIRYGNEASAEIEHITDAFQE